MVDSKSKLKVGSVPSNNGIYILNIYTNNTQ